MGKNFVLSIYFFILIFFHCISTKPEKKDILHPFDLRCEMLCNPMGVDVLQPRLSWKLNSQQRDQFQSAYRILVASDPETLAQDHGDLWDSGKILSSQSAWIAYKGVPLKSGMFCYWKVKVWDKKNRASEWSEPAFWSMGLLRASDWKAQWIGLDQPAGKDDVKSLRTRLSARMLRKEFEIPEIPQRGVVYMSGLGLSELYINGHKIGDQVLSPGLTEYKKRIFYVTHDVTSFLQKGRNAIGVMLGNGRYFPPRNDEHVESISYPKLLFQMHLEYKNGKIDTLLSDTTWKITTQGPILANNEYDGEIYDARKEMRGWTLPHFDDTQWEHARGVQPPGGKLVSQMMNPIKITQTLQPVDVRPQRSGVYIVDMGQNMVGWIQIQVHRPKPGQMIRMRFGETLTPHGELFTANLRTAQAEDIYICRGDSLEIYEPHFTYHGFRFVEIIGYPGDLQPADIIGKVVHDAVEPTGTFTCSHPILSRIYHNCVWGIRGNYRSIPTDCPQRDERQGWLGDRAIEAKGESYVFHIYPLYKKWLNDISDAQTEEGQIPNVAPTYWKVYRDNVTWPGAFLFLTDMLFSQYGDTEMVRIHYPAMAKWMHYMKKYLKDSLMTQDVYGDWCVPPESQNLIHTKDLRRKTPPELIGTAYFYQEAKLMAKFARLLGFSKDAQEYSALADQLKKAFHAHCFDSAKNQYGNGSVTSLLLPLAFHMVPESNLEKVKEALFEKILGEYEGHIATGLLGTQWILRTLSDLGRIDVAYRLATHTSYPSWGYMVQKGATTIWELWNGDTADPSMNSGNHVMLIGDLVIWLYEYLAGIQPDPDHPGFARFQLRPNPIDDLTEVRASFQSNYGLIHSHWKIEKGRFLWNVTIPANTKARVYVPCANEKWVKESGKPAKKAKGVRLIQMESNRVVYEVGSGTYQFVVEPYVPIHKPISQVETPQIFPKDTSSAFPAKIHISMSSSTPGAQIRYTLDGTEPDTTSFLYIAPFETDRFVILTARAFKKGMQPSYKKISVIDIFHPDINGFRYRYYEGKWNVLPDFSKLRAKKNGTVTTLDLSKIKMRQDNYGILFEANLRIPLAGEYTFYLASDDGSRLFIDHQKVVENDSLHALTEKKGKIWLSEGKHSIRIEYFENSLEEMLLLDIEGPHLPRTHLPMAMVYLK